MTRHFLWGLLVAMAACGPLVTMPAYVPDPDVSDFMEQETCLDREVCSEIQKRGNDPEHLDTAADTAALTCHLPIEDKERRHLISTQVHIDWQDEVNREDIERLEGYYSGLEMREDFQCLVACLYTVFPC